MLNYLASRKPGTVEFSDGNGGDFSALVNSVIFCEGMAMMEAVVLTVKGPNTLTAEYDPPVDIIIPVSNFKIYESKEEQDAS